MPYPYSKSFSRINQSTFLFLASSIHHIHVWEEERLRKYYVETLSSLSRKDNIPFENLRNIFSLSTTCGRQPEEMMGEGNLWRFNFPKTLESLMITTTMEFRRVAEGKFIKIDYYYYWDQFCHIFRTQQAVTHFSAKFPFSAMMQNGITCQNCWKRSIKFFVGYFQDA